MAGRLCCGREGQREGSYKAGEWVAIAYQVSTMNVCDTYRSDRRRCKALIVLKGVWQGGL